jgi:hypothetical protein
MSILRDLFGPSCDEIRQQFAAVVSGNFTEKGFWNGSKVVATQSQWTVTLDTCTHDYSSRRPFFGRGSNQNSLQGTWEHGKWRKKSS